MLVTFFGTLVAGIAGATLALGLIALAALSYLGWTATAAQLAAAAERGALAAARARRAGLLTAGAVGSAVAAFGALGVRLVADDVATALLATALAVGTAAAAAATCSAAACLTAMKAGARLESSASSRRERIAAAQREARRALEARGKRLAAGDDLRDEIALVDAALVELDAAVERLSRLRDEAEAANEARSTAAHRELCRELAGKLALAETVRAAARTLAHRLRCAEPVRTILRRRPRDLAAELGQATDDAGRRAVLEDAARTLGRFVAETAKAIETVEAIEPPAGDAPEAEDAQPDPRDVAKRDLEALAAAYRSVLDRVQVALLRARADVHVAEVADAAGAVSTRAASAEPSKGALDDLVLEVGRAEAVLGAGSSSDTSERPRILRGVLERSVAALNRDDGESLHEVLTALREIE